MQCDFMAEIIHFLWDMVNDIELRKPSMSRAEDVFVCTFLRCGVSNRRSGLCIVLRQFSRHMFCYANQMSKALPRKRHAELEELDFKL